VVPSVAWDGVSNEGVVAISVTDLDEDKASSGIVGSLVVDRGLVVGDVEALDSRLSCGGKGQKGSNGGLHDRSAVEELDRW
jgi:hypothetical protein